MGSASTTTAAPAATVTRSLHAIRCAHRFEGTDVLVAAGRIPNTASIGLDVVGVQLDSRGYLDVTSA